MKRSVFIVVIVVVGVVGLLAGIYANKLFQKQSTPASNTAGPVVSVPEIRPDFGLMDLHGKLRNVSEWDGKVLMINFWATWCPPCRREIPAFIKLQQTYQDKGFTIVGVAIDTKQNAIDFVDPMGINYPVLVGEHRGISLAKDYGNRLGVLPYTVIVNRDGKIVYTHRNELTYDEAEKLIKPLL